MADRVTAEQRAGGLEVPRGGVQVYDKRAGSVRHVSPEEAERGVLAGTMESKTPVQIRRGNEVRTLDDTAKLAEAKAYGWSVTDDAGAYQARIEREEDTIGGQIQGTAESVASGLTFGVSDVLLGGGRGSEDRKRYQARNKAAGEVADAGRLAGEVLPVLFSGGLGAAGKVGATAGKSGLRRTLGGAAKAVTRAPVALEAGGAAVERGVARALGGGIKGRVAGSAARGVVEGGASGVGQAVHEAVLGDRDLTGEYLLASGGMSALMGGGVGGAFPLVGKGAGGLAKMPVQATRKVLGAAAEMAPEGGIIGGLAQTLASGKRSGPAAEQASMLMSKGGNKKLHRALHQQDEVLEEIGSSIRAASEKYNKAQADAVSAFERTRAENFGELLNDAGDGATGRMVADDAGSVLARLDEHMAVAKDPAYRKKFDQLALDRSAAALRLARDGAAGSSASKAYHSLHNGLRDVQEQLSRLRKSGKEPDTVEMLVDIEGRLKGALGSPKYGRAAEAFKDVSRHDALYFEAIEKTKGSAVGRLLDRQKLSTNADALSVAKSHGDFKAKDRVSNAQEAMAADLKALRKRAEYTSDPKLKAAVKKVAAEQATLARALDDAAENAQILGRQREMNRAPLSGILSAAGPSGPMVTGGIIGGLPGAMVGGAMAMAARPGNTIRTLSAIRHAVDATGVDLDRIIKTVTRGRGAAQQTGAERVGSLRKMARRKRSVKRAARVSKSAALRASAQAHQLRSKEQREKSRRAAELADPDRLAEILARDLYDVMNVAPDLGGAMSERVHAAASFLADKLPPESVDPITGAVTIVDDVSRDRFDRYYEAVTDPVKTLERLETGKFTSEHSEAIKEVWPRLFEEMQGKVFVELAEAADRGDPLPMSAKVSLGVLFDLATDPTMTGKFQAQRMSVLGAGAAQAQQQEQEQSEAEQGATPPGKRTRKVNSKTPQRYSTTIGRIERNDV